ncbi:MAG TPA: glycoside hydrolase family 78 protein [Candidatus Acetatifactor stercoripullorum]|uniref:alpha-L-rhamnosidase n=1 Tax=Candidatus Acetatifactor stercoripullorum TaxID=2838414 RepID=A0A9D1R6G7_9FIRM|nr:family 78 glycoside hydrolase catalytic domain [uncultured Acetatifactor sp.]HIW80936.1 glycoside hydrolase family 78 protein [Candidatus Acetatifactor stercoripullorum]
MDKMKIMNLFCNHMECPLGIAEGEAPRLSWTTEAPPESRLRCRVMVSLSPDFSDPLFDTGKDGKPDSICLPLPIKLLPRTRYYWRVSAADQKGNTADACSWFETAKLAEPWSADWISPYFDPSWHPVLFKDIFLPAPAVRARAYICGLGLYELFINKDRCHEDVLSPGLCAYDKWLPYQTHDITGFLKPGANRICISLGNGWYKGRYGLTRDKEFRYGETFACICELHVQCADGSLLRFGTDTSWSAARSPILSSSIFDGEIRDDTLSRDTVYPVRRVSISKSLLEPRRSPAAFVMEKRTPLRLLKTPAGEMVLDMGQNMTGWLEFKCSAPKGFKLHLQFGEVLQDGNFYRDNLRTAKAEYRYISDGVPKVVRPAFTFYGFRYVRLTSWYQTLEEICLEDFAGLVLYSGLRTTGSFKSGNALVNKLFENTMWGQKGNFLDVPTDCPQRDERMGWTGDAQVFFGTAAYNMDVSAFFDKYCYDLMKEQNALDGDVPVVIPKHNVIQTGSCAWGDAAVMIPWNHYVRYGDIEFLKRQYPSMKAWVNHIYRHDQETGASRLWQGSFHYCDWLSLDGEDPIGNRFGGTERTYLASCYYRHSTSLLTKAAQALGYQEDAFFYRQLSEQVRDAIIEEYITKTGRLALTTQTAYVLALMFDIIPEKWREKTAYALRLKLKESKYHLRTGFLGTPYLCRALSENGSNDISYYLLLQEDFPSWLYEVKMGATTIWERWNSILPDGRISDTGMNSLNHYSYGSIVEWMYRNAAGIQPLEDFPGFRRFLLRPQPHPLLGSLDVSFQSPVGLIKSAWKYEEDGTLSFRFHIPHGASARLVLPFCADAPACLEAGDYSFTADRKYLEQSPYDLDTPISRLLADPKAAKALDKELPSLSRMMLFPMMSGERSLRDFMKEKFFTLTPEQEEALCRSLNAQLSLDI